MNALGHTVKSTFDHWWPRALQSYWIADDGYVTITSSGGSVARKKPVKGSKIAGRQRGHEFSVGGSQGPSPWDHSFEDIFDRADNSVHKVVRRFTSIKPVGEADPILHHLGECRHFFSPHLIARSYCGLSEMKVVLELVFSLLHRNPHFRHVYASAGQRIGLPDDPMIGQMNIQHQFSFVQSMLDIIEINNVSVCAALSDRPEFVFGDGIYSTLKMVCPVLGDKLMPRARGSALIPLTPRVCLLVFSRNTRSIKNNVYYVQLRPSEVAAVNRITQAHKRFDDLLKIVKPDNLR